MPKIGDRITIEFIMASGSQPVDEFEGKIVNVTPKDVTTDILTSKGAPWPPIETARLSAEGNDAWRMTFVFKNN